jgi:hypothetical protein
MNRLFRNFPAIVSLSISAFATSAAPGLAQEAPKVIRTFPSAVSSGKETDSPLFRTLTPGLSGLDFLIPIDNSHPERRLYYSAMACGSVATGDLDGDGWPEVFFAAGPVSNRLYRNSGEKEGPRFVEVPDAAGLSENDSWCTGSTMVDIDGDGDLDVYVCRYDEPNQLFLNESTPDEFRFREAAAEWGLDIKDATLSPSFVDYDRDGDLDVFLAINAYYRKGGRPEEGVPMRKTETGWEVVEPWDRFFRFSSLDPFSGEPKYDETGRPNRLLRNEGGRFSDVSSAAGLLPASSHTNAAAWLDYDNDGWLDLYVANDFADRDELYLNQKDGTFREVAPDVLQHTTWFSMGMAAEDFNNDGMTDLVVADMLPSTHYRQKVTMGEMGASFAAMYEAGLPRQNMVNTYFVNTGTGFFLEAARMSGISKTDWTWTVKSGDLDGDGRIDLFFPTGHTRDFNHSDYKGATPLDRIGKEDWDFFIDRPELREHDLVFRNSGDWKFEKSDDAWGLGQRETMTYGAAISDIDRDGDLDLISISLEDAPVLYLNRSNEKEGRNHLLIRLKGRSGNTYGFGAKVTLTLPDGARQTRTLLPSNGYQESDEPLIHFGMGSFDHAASIQVDWGTGNHSHIGETKGNRWIEITEATEPASRQEPITQSPWFRTTPNFEALATPETSFDDFLRQPLLPHRHSQLGPGQAWGDIDGDDRPDLYLGGTKGQPGKMLLYRGLDAEGLPFFTMKMRTPFTGMTDHEDLGALLLDVDGDGDSDLFTVSGSVECSPGDPSLRDRLYLNDGTGAFTEVMDRIPAPGQGNFTSGSVATAADFDRDGDLDIFIGGRIIPGEYPVAARNSFLVNDGTGHFQESSADHGISSTGLVTAALWSDIDRDGWSDLLIAHEWGAIRVFSNQEGKLIETTEAAGLAGATGFWNSIAGRDLNGDGAIDYIAGNLGRNTKYSASPKSPELIFYGDVGGSGKKNLIEAKVDPSKACLLPRRGLSCSSTAIPNLLKHVNTYHGWASAALEEIYDPERLKEALRLEATMLDSVALINDGEGHFTVHPLPPLAQLAPVFGIAMSDFDGDGFTDVALAQNFFTPQQETGPYDGGLGLLLKGKAPESSGEIPLTEMWPIESGIVVPGDGKSLGITDFTGRGRPDLIFGRNNAPPAFFINETETKNSGEPLAVTLKGKPGNPTAIGAMVSVQVRGIPKQTAEIHSGSGYLSQSVPTLFFGRGANSKSNPATISVVWPDGTRSEQSIPSGEGPQISIRWE